MADSFGSRVSELRLKLGLSQSELAIRCQLDVYDIMYFELGHKSPTPQHLRKLSEGLGVTPDFLVGRTPLPLEVIDKMIPLLEGKWGHMTDHAKMDFLKVTMLNLAKVVKQILEDQRS